MTFFNEFISGAFAGVTQVLVGHPFDTLKVIIQNNSNIKQFSIKNLYRGVKYPLPQSIICNSIVFSINDNLKYKFSNRLYSGFISGLCVTPIIFYLDIGKTKEQLRLPYKSIDLFRNFHVERSFFELSYRNSDCASFNLRIRDISVTSTTYFITSSFSFISKID